ncbi:MAG: N-acetyltransferase [Peptococcaceae bacterium]|jgi:hypothetical protein|nr:N-acetyltransferase [Peptococcaceae bacterium]
MKIIRLSSIKQYRRFYATVYGGDLLYKDNKTALLPLVCGKRSSFRRNSWQEMVAVAEVGKILCQCVLIVHAYAPDRMNIAFFEALPNSAAAVRLLLIYAEEAAKRSGCSRLIAGMDGHLNYSMGFGGDCSSPPSFGESFDPPYYAAYFEGFLRIGLTSFQDGINDVRRRVDADYRRFAAKMGQYRMEPSAIHKRSLSRYTDLSNAIFADHIGYFNRAYDEDYELFRSMMPILGDHNLIFIKEGDLDIGYIFWYPDFNELVKPGSRFGVKEAAQYHLLRKPKTVKVVEIGVLPDYRDRGLVMLALKSAIDMVAEKMPATERVISSWIADGNTKSLLFAQRYTRNHYKDFALYEKML